MCVLLSRAVIGEPPRFPDQQTPDMFTYEVDANGVRQDLRVPCDITNKSMASFEWFREGEAVPSEMVDLDGSLVVVNITEGEYADHDGVEYYCIATKEIGKNDYTAAVRSRTIKVFYACESLPS